MNSLTKIIEMLLELLRKIFPPTPAPAPEDPPAPTPDPPGTTETFESAPGRRRVLELVPGSSIKWIETFSNLLELDPEEKRSIAACRSSSQYLEVRSYKIKLSPQGAEPRYSFAWAAGRRYDFELRLSQTELSFWVDNVKMASTNVNAGTWQVALGWPFDSWPKPGVSGFVSYTVKE